MRANMMMVMGTVAGFGAERVAAILATTARVAVAKAASSLMKSAMSVGGAVSDTVAVLAETVGFARGRSLVLFGGFQRHFRHQKCFVGTGSWRAFQFTSVHLSVELS